MLCTYMSHSCKPLQFEIFLTMKWGLSVVATVYCDIACPLICLLIVVGAYFDSRWRKEAFTTIIYLYNFAIYVMMTMNINRALLLLNSHVISLKQNMPLQRQL